ncbi:hypothetical protein [Massilia sp. TSP1-1-2]|uniref:hypothetical protein n=1 Tax=Massilia sp. TSP1-1-2 TaxID=2804649 RepID=UPI003CE73AD7
MEPDGAGMPWQTFGGKRQRRHAVANVRWKTTEPECRGKRRVENDMPACRGKRRVENDTPACRGKRRVENDTPACRGKRRAEKGKARIPPTPQEPDSTILTIALRALSQLAGGMRYAFPPYGSI